MLGIRLFVDFLLKRIDFFAFGSGYTIMFFYFMQIVFPVILLSHYKVINNVQKVGFWLVAILSVCMILSILKIAKGEVEITRDGRFDNGFGIFSIEFGHYAVSLILISVLLLKSKIKNVIKPILIITIFIGSLAAILAGSRGPIMALIVCLAIYAISNTGNITKLLKIICILAIISPFIVYWAEEITDFFSSMGIRSAERIYNAFLGEESITNQTSGRDTLYKDAIYYFSESPLLGYSYLIPGKIYCHNILLEQYMALGIIGGSIFLGINIIGLRSAWNILRYHRGYALIPLLYIQYFIFGCFSTTIINLPQYWLFLLLTMNYSSTISAKKFIQPKHTLSQVDL
ncbi:MAG: O-antigen ligase family protein [Muribaculaceae bacterium]|nr:O-antigen ligase family protein [Muribaculaceae bacterium]